MSWQCNYCGNKTQPVKEVEPNGIDYPAGRACYECGKGEMVYRPIDKETYHKMRLLNTVSSKEGNICEI